MKLVISCSRVDKGGRKYLSEIHRSVKSDRKFCDWTFDINQALVFTDIQEAWETAITTPKGMAWIEMNDGWYVPLGNYESNLAGVK